MTLVSILLYSAIAVVFICCLIRVIRHGEQDDTVFVPRVVHFDYPWRYTAQEVFDWIVYATKLVGPSYLDSLKWQPTLRHDFLLCDLQTVVQYQTQEEMLEQFKAIGRDHQLDISTVDTPV